MIEAVIGWGIGVVLGLGYFLGLRWTVERIVGVEHPVRALVLSFFVRATVLVVVTAVVIRWSLVGLVGAAIGFAVVRTLLLRRARRSLTWS